MSTELFNKKAINAIRYIGLKSIQEAKGGHVGMTISAAPITYTLYTKFININPKDGKWINRDRFVLSGGHGSMSVYPILYLSGLLNKKDMMDFKVEDSKTPGHPEFEKEKHNFIDASTGPLGQGIAMAVGMALGQKIAYEKTKNDFPEMFTNYTYVVCGDGDLQEGISYEAMAIAGKYNLDKLIVLHDSNKFQLDSAVDVVSIENLKLRAESNNWFYQKCSNDPDMIEKAIKKAQKANKPSFIEVETVIAEGLSVGNSDKGHHGVVTNEDLDKFQKYHGTNFSGWEMSEGLIDHFKKSVAKRGSRAYKKWQATMNEYEITKKDKFEKIMTLVENNIDYTNIFNKVEIDKKDQATRVYLKTFLNVLDKKSPFSIATCADLVASTNLVIGKKSILENGQNLPLGIREFAMGAIMNGLALYGPFRPIGGTFLVFADYIKSAIRLGALMKMPTTYVFTHDSYQVGGDGPTHQPYDQLPMLRAIENVVVHRPADEEELRYAMIESYNSKNDTNILVLTRQNVPSLKIKRKQEDMAKGAYIVKDAKEVDFVIAASGSEVSLALEIASKIPNVRVVSVPCLNKAIKMSSKEKRMIFGANKALITMEASSDFMWFNLHLDKQKNLHLGAYSFGKSMDGVKLYKDKGFNIEVLMNVIKKFN